VPQLSLCPTAAPRVAEGLQVSGVGQAVLEEARGGGLVLPLPFSWYEFSFYLLDWS